MMDDRRLLVGCLIFCGVLILLYAVTITIIFALQSSNTKFTEKQQRTKCETYGCVQAAAQIVSYVDESIDPCVDFYKFANGLYIKEMTGDTEDWDSRSFYSTITRLVNKKIGPLLSEPSQHDEWRAITLAKSFYKSCLSQSIIVSKDNKKLLIDLLRVLGGWPVVQGTWLSSEFNLIELIQRIRAVGLDTNSIFTVNVGVDPKNTTNRRLEIDVGNYEHNEENEKKLYNTPVYFIENYDKSAAARVKLEMKRVWTFEEKLVNYHIYENPSDNDDIGDGFGSGYSGDSDSEINSSDEYVSYDPTMTTIKELQKSYPYLNWLEYINAILPSGFSVTEDEPIMNKNPLFFKNLGGISKSISTRTLVNYVLWRAIYSIYQLETEEIGKKRRDICVSLASEKFSTPVTLLYSRKYFNETSRQAVINLVGDVRLAFVDMLRNVTWMDNDTRRKAIEKAENIVAHIGYPSGLLESHILHEYYGQLDTIEPDNYFKNSLVWNVFNNNQIFNSLRRPANRSGLETTIYLKPNEANAFYMPSDNTMQFPIAILHEKFFSMDRPNYINYASLGSTVGHEITHGFDDDGRRYDLHGNKVNWWNPETKSRFVKNSECFVQQYSRYTHTRTQLTVDGDRTKNENIADNGGIRAAYYAYQNWIERNEPEELVPGIKYNQNQLFWISYALAMGGVFGENYLINQMTDVHKVHAPNEFRVNGVVSNTKEFAKDFNCAMGTKMNPEKKCNIW